MAAEAHALQQRAGALPKLGALGLELGAVRLDDLERQQHVVHRRSPRQQRRRLNFIPLQQQPARLFLPMKLVAGLFAR